MVITIGETSLPLMLIILGEAAFGRLSLVAIAGGFFGPQCLLRTPNATSRLAFQLQRFASCSIRTSDRDSAVSRAG
jgi:hypothetical protein